MPESRHRENGFFRGKQIRWELGGRGQTWVQTPTFQPQGKKVTSELWESKLYQKKKKYNMPKTKDSFIPSFSRLDPGPT